MVNFSLTSVNSMRRMENLFLEKKVNINKLNPNKIFTLNVNIMFLGISLSIGQWNKLKELIDDIQESVEKLG